MADNQQQLSEVEEFEVPVFALKNVMLTERALHRKLEEELREKYHCSLEKHGEVI